MRANYWETNGERTFQALQALTDRHPSTLSNCFLSLGLLASEPLVALDNDGRRLCDGKWIELAGKQVNGVWSAFTGAEQVILGELSEIVDGEPVQVAK